MKKSLEIEDLLNRMVDKLKEQYSDNPRCLILYNSCAEGAAREDPEIYLIGIFERVK